MIGETIDRYRVVEKLGQAAWESSTRPATPSSAARRAQAAATRLGQGPAPSATLHRRGQGRLRSAAPRHRGRPRRPPGRRARRDRHGARSRRDARAAHGPARAAARPRRCATPSRWPTRSPAPTPPASCTATSSRRTSWSRADDTAKVLDFGLAKLAEAPFPGDETPTISAGPTKQPVSRRARSSARSPTCRPEQARGQDGRRAHRRLLLRRAALPDAHGPPPLQPRLVARDALGHPRGGPGAARAGRAGPAAGGRAGHPALPAQGPVPPLAEHVRPQGRAAGPARGLGVRARRGPGPRRRGAAGGGPRCPGRSWQWLRRGRGRPLAPRAAPAPGPLELRR